eukprot:4103544-Prymnesium_polylepis.1
MPRGSSIVSVLRTGDSSVTAVTTVQQTGVTCSGPIRLRRALELWASAQDHIRQKAEGVTVCGCSPL